MTHPGYPVSKASWGACRVLFLLLLTISASFSCKTLKIPPSNPEQLEKFVILDKGECMGNCSVYTFTVYRNGFSLFEGGKDATRVGPHFRYLKADEMETIRDAFLEIPFAAYQDHYISDLPDLQTVTITYFPEDGPVKSVRGKENRPEEIIQLEKKLGLIANTGNWKSYKGGAFTTASGSAPDTDELIVQLLNGTDIDQWVGKFAGISMKKVRQISPNMPYWLVTFKARDRTPEQVLQMVRSDPQVIGAQFNRQVDMRN